MSRSPELEFPGETPYDHYARTMQLHQLQQPVTDEPVERPFLVISQVMELYFGLLRDEFRVAAAQLRADNIDQAITTLQRCVHHFRGLNASWDSLRWMTPMEFNSFREGLGVASGFQSWAYRFVEFAMGLKDAKLIQIYENNPVVWQELNDALAAPSIYEEALIYLNRHGYLLPETVTERDFAQPYAPNEAVQEMWVQIYTELPTHAPEQLLATVLTDIAEEFHEWRVLHLRAVQRSMGAKVGTGGSSGIAWLEQSMARPVFNDLWTARTAVGQ